MEEVRRAVEDLLAVNCTMSRVSDKDGVRIHLFTLLFKDCSRQGRLRTTTGC